MLPKFPRRALQVLRIIREDVPRPDSLPKGTYTCIDSLRWDGYCPMGLHPDSTMRCPGASGFAGRRCDPRSVFVFGLWWDKHRESNAEEAVNFIWKED